MLTGGAPGVFEVYRGGAGQTGTKVVHVSAPTGALIAARVYVSINGQDDPELAARLLGSGPALGALAADGREYAVEVPVAYHDPQAGIFVLVLGEGDRHRELACRVELLQRLMADDADVPTYAKDFAVAFGAAGLRTYLSTRATTAAKPVRTARATQIRVQRASESPDPPVPRTITGGRSRSAPVTELGPTAPPVVVTLDRETPVEQETRRFDTIDSDDDVVAPVPAPPPVAAQLAAPSAAPPEAPLVETAPVLRAAAPAADAEMPTDADPVVTEFYDVAVAASDADAWLTAWLANGAASSVALLGNDVRVAVRVPAGRTQRLHQGPVDVHMALHRMPTAPVVTLAFGTAASIRTADSEACAVVAIDISHDGERAAFAALGREFAITLDLMFVDGSRRRGRLVGRLAENAGFVLRAADDHRRAVVARGGELAFAPARAGAMHPDHDLFGARHPERDRFHEESFVRLSTASMVQRALGVAALFTKPANEDFLVCARGYALSRWREVRRGVLARAVEWGLWMGPDLAQVAISEGFARSRRDLLARLGAGFDLLRTLPQFHDLLPEATEQNLQALASEAEAVGGGIGNASASSRDAPAAPIATASDDLVASGDAVSGMIVMATGLPAGAGQSATASVETLIARLEDRAERLDAAIELCERADPRGLEPVMAAVRRMSRSEAVRVLGMMVRFGTGAAPVLVEGLASSKSFLRHGCALALAMLRTEAGTEAVVDLLLREPTEIWREIARAVGQVGPAALMPLASNLGRMGDRASASARERVAWAMAHVAVRGGKVAVEALAAGQSVVAPVAQQAVGLIAPASRDEIRVRTGAGNSGTQPGREVTVNRAFSRRFFEAVERGLPAIGMAELSAMEASEPMELLDETDLVDDDIELVPAATDDGGEALDERDLLP